MRVRFSDFTLDTDRRELTRGFDVLHLAPKAFQLLQILVERRPKAVSQPELQDLLWPDTFVEKGAIHNLIHQIRTALDDHGPSIIATAYGFGFSFDAAAVEDAPRTTRWQLVIGEQVFDLHEGENVVGRERDTAISIDASCISRHHARIVVSPDGVRIEDLGSKNGTLVAGRRIRSVPLRSGDRILFGNVVAALRALEPLPTTETVL